ncbi:hypothetical protein HanIR_Chr02g0080501 [Helianthus annuus]|nr:hypothetical protein HanIR_Chr02g0080501 [Helianthus annuus]
MSRPHPCFVFLIINQSHNMGFLYNLIAQVKGGPTIFLNASRTHSLGVRAVNEHEQGHVRVRSLRKLTCSRTVHERIPNISLCSCSFVKQIQLFTNSL